MIQRALEALYDWNIASVEEMIASVKATNNYIELGRGFDRYYLNYDGNQRWFSLKSNSHRIIKENVCPFSSCTHIMGECRRLLDDFLKKFRPADLFIAPLQFPIINQPGLSSVIDQLRREGIIESASSPEQCRDGFLRVLEGGEIQRGSMHFFISPNAPQNVRFQDDWEGTKCFLCHHFPGCTNVGSKRRNNLYYCFSCEQSVPKVAIVTCTNREDGRPLMKATLRLAADLAFPSEAPNLKSWATWESTMKFIHSRWPQGLSHVISGQWVKMFITPKGQLAFEFEGDTGVQVFVVCMYPFCFSKPIEEECKEDHANYNHVLCQKHFSDRQNYMISLSAAP